jgi:hypothetical protein
LSIFKQISVFPYINITKEGRKRKGHRIGEGREEERGAE